MHTPHIELTLHDTFSMNLVVSFWIQHSMVSLIISPTYFFRTISYATFSNTHIPLALHSSLLKDIERESKQILEPDHHKFYYVMGWLLQFRFCIYSKWKADIQKQHEKNAEQLQLSNRKNDESNDTSLENPANFDLVASAMDIRFFLLCIRRMRQTFDERQWLDVQTCAECFKQMVTSCCFRLYQVS
jgi:hypothetical protein